MTEPERRLFNPREVAQRIAEGFIVRVGDYLTIRLDGADLAMGCTRCAQGETRTPFKKTPLLTALGELARFVHRHQHAERS